MSDEVLDKIREYEEKLSKAQKRIDAQCNEWSDLYDELDIIKRSMGMKTFEIEYSAKNKSNQSDVKAKDILEGVNGEHAVFLFKQEANLYHPESFKLINFRRLK